MERQELWCHECQKYVQFDIDTELNGQHVIVCPSCGHEHLRVVENGVISEARWGSRNGNNSIPQTYLTTGMTTSAASTYNSYVGTGVTTGSTQYNYSAWMNLTGSTRSYS